MCFVPDPYKISPFTDLQKSQTATKFCENGKKNLPEKYFIEAKTKEAEDI